VWRRQATRWRTGAFGYRSREPPKTAPSRSAAHCGRLGANRKGDEKYIYHYDGFRLTIFTSLKTLANLKTSPSSILLKSWRSDGANSPRVECYVNAFYRK